MVSLAVFTLKIMVSQKTFEVRYCLLKDRLSAVIGFRG